MGTFYVRLEECTYWLINLAGESGRQKAVKAACRQHTLPRHKRKKTLLSFFSLFKSGSPLLFFWISKEKKNTALWTSLGGYIHGSLFFSRIWGADWIHFVKMWACGYYKDFVVEWTLEKKGEKEYRNLYKRRCSCCLLFPFVFFVLDASPLT